MRAWALLVIALLLLPLGGSPAVAESCGGRPPVNVARLPGVTPQGLPSVGLQPAQVRRSTCNYLMLSLKGRVEYVSGAHVLLRGPDGHLRLYDLRSRRAYALDQGPVLSPKTDGRWVVYAKYWLAEGQPLRYRWYSGLPVLARAYPGAEPNRSEIYALDLASGRRRLVASSRVPGYSTTTLPQLDLSEGRLVYRIVRGDPTAPTSEVHLVELASGRDQVLRTYRWPRYVHEVAIDGSLVAWSLITARDTGKPSATARVYLYDLAARRGRIVSGSGRDWHPDLAAGRVAWVRAGALDSPGRIVLYAVSSGRATQVTCSRGASGDRCLADRLVIGDRVLAWHAPDGRQVQYDLLSGRTESLDQEGQMVTPSTDGLEESWSAAYSVGRGQGERVVYRSTVLLYMGADERSLPRMPRTGGGGMAWAEGCGRR